MRRLLPALATLPLALWGCDGGASPALSVEVPDAQLRSEGAQERGRLLYVRHCALCHGERADGVGVRRSLSSRPQDFTDPTWNERTRPQDVYLVIRDGRRGTAMAAWGIFDERQTWDLVAYLLSVGRQASR